VGKHGGAREATDENIIRRMRFVCRITKATHTHTQNMYYFVVLRGNSEPKGKRSLGRPRPNGRIILKCMFKKSEEEGIGLIWLRTGQMAGSSNCGNELPVSIKCGEFLD
jgi:hypothetical protein